MALSPILDNVDMGRAFPRDRPGMLGDDNLEPSVNGIEERPQGLKHSVYAVDIRRPVWLARRHRRFVYRRPRLRKVDLAGLVDDEESRHRILDETNEMLMEREQPGDMITHPVLPAAYLPEEIRSS